MPVDSYGRVNPDHVANAIKEDTILVSIMHSNNEIGTIQPIEEISKITKDKNVIFHSDAVDSVGVVPIDVEKLGIDALSFASNPFYGPTGVGGLYVRSGLKIWPLIEGGVQESNRRAGTENLIGIIGMGVAADLALKDMDARIVCTQKRSEKSFLRNCQSTLMNISLMDILSIVCRIWYRCPLSILKVRVLGKDERPFPRMKDAAPADPAATYAWVVEFVRATLPGGETRPRGPERV